MRRRWRLRAPDLLALLALLPGLGTWGAWGLWLDGYSPLSHPFALPGAHGLPRAFVFNTLVFVLPGALMAVLAERWRRQCPAPQGWWLRIASGLALLAALGWLAQGLLPLDMEHLDAGDSRWHALAWTLWWMAAGSSALLMALAASKLRGWSLALLAVLALPWVWPGALPAGVMQAAAFLVWGGWSRAAAAH